MTSTEPRTDIFEHRPDEPVSEQLLLAAARDGSTGAFGILYARHREHAVAVARRALPAGDGSLAEDVAESAFIDVFTALRNGKGPTDTLRFYLVTAVRRQAWRVQRRQRRQSDSFDRWSVEQAASRPAEAAPSPSDVELGGHLVLTEAFRSLAPRWRHVLWLTEVEGRKAAEIAPLLGLSSGSASALAYRARQGLVAAYLAACAPHRSDSACNALTERLGAYLSARDATEGFADVEAHLEGCRSCRDVSRGVDLAGSTLGGAAPFGLLTLGWWAQGVAAGAGAKVGVALGGAAVAAGSSASAASIASSGATAGSSAVGVAATVAAIVVAVVAAGAAALGWAGGDRGSEAASATRQTEVAGASAEAAASLPGDEPAPLDRPPGSSAPATIPPGSIAAPLAPPVADEPPAPAAPALLPIDPPARPAPPTTTPPAPTTALPATTTTSSVATTVASTTSTLVTSTTAVTTTLVAPTTEATSTTEATTTTEPEVDPPGTGVLSGRIVVEEPAAPDEATGVEGVRIVLVRSLSGASTSVRTGPDGRWLAPRLASGRYLVLAEVPAAYAPRAGLDPWLGGPTWTAVLGVVDVDDGPIDLVDLRLVLR